MAITCAMEMPRCSAKAVRAAPLFTPRGLISILSIQLEVTSTSGQSAPMLARRGGSSAGSLMEVTTNLLTRASRGSTAPGSVSTRVRPPSRSMNVPQTSFICPT